MGRSSGLGALLAVLALAFVFMRPRELTQADFIPTFGNGSPSRTFSYSQYVTYVTKPEDELEEGEELKTYTSPSGREGRYLTINGRIPTPSGGSIPDFSTRDLSVRLKVDEMLQPIEEAKTYDEEPQDRLENGKMRFDVSARLKPI